MKSYEIIEAIQRITAVLAVGTAAKPYRPMSKIPIKTTAHHCVSL
jgi:hypothetical protein